uniref:Uncharacterized protein n=1 Tax=Daphnia galeata TaxID=27404 RepID=A0A8J2RJL9_9CRUS|nr:unnamed protein product [Daphnia galeata]
MNDLKMFDTFSKIQEVNLNHLGKIKFRLMNAIEKWNETSECILSEDDIESLLKQSKIADNIITNEYAQWAQLKQIEVKERTTRPQLSKQTELENARLSSSSSA